MVDCAYLESSIAVHEIVNARGKYEFIKSSTNGLVLICVCVRVCVCMCVCVCVCGGEGGGGGVSLIV